MMMTDNPESTSENSSENPRSAPGSWRDVNPAALFNDFKAALGRLTLLRSDVAEDENAPLRVLRAYPLAGAFLGVLGGLGFLLASALTLPDLVAAVIAAGLVFAATGGRSETAFARAVERMAGQARGPQLAMGPPAPVGTVAMVLLVIAKISLLAGLGAKGGAGLALLGFTAALAAAYAAHVAALHFAHEIEEAVPERPPEAVTLQALVFAALIAFLTLHVWIALVGLFGALFGLVIGSVLAIRRGQAFFEDALAIVREFTLIAFLASAYMVLA